LWLWLCNIDAIFATQEIEDIYKSIWIWFEGLGSIYAEILMRRKTETSENGISTIYLYMLLK